MKLILRTLAIIFLISSYSKDHQTNIDNSRCEYQIDPLRSDIKNPRFFWEIEDSPHGAKQTAYQILVSSGMNKRNKSFSDNYIEIDINS